MKNPLHFERGQQWTGCGMRRNVSCEPKKLSGLTERPQCHSEEEFGEFLSEGGKEARALFVKELEASVGRLVFHAFDVCVWEERALLCFVCLFL